ncbi:MAG: hypothetical protein ACLFR0_07850 [Alphaproteobacteria bacterium]
MLSSEKLQRRIESKKRLLQMEKFLGAEWDEATKVSAEQENTLKKRQIANSYASVVSALEDLDR